MDAPQVLLTTPDYPPQLGGLSTFTVMIENTPIDYLDFASPVSGLGSKMGLDATNKWQGETDREWGEPIAMSDSVKDRVDSIWHELGIDD